MTTFETPPPPTGRRGTPRTAELLALAADLTANPGEWARVGEYKTDASTRTTASLVRTGKLAGFAPRGAFEATARTDSGRPVVHARFVGTPAGGDAR